jgi:hypothetical protein
VLCPSIIGPSQVSSPLPTRMRATTLCHAGVVRELTVLRASMSSTTERVLGRSPGRSSWMEAVNKLTLKLQQLEELCSWLKRSCARICNPLLGPLPDQSCWADRLEEAAGHLEAAMARWCHTNADLEALRASTALVRDSVLGDSSRSSSLVASLAKMAGEDKNQINTAAANGVEWGTRSMLVAVLSHFLELEPKLELLMSSRDTDTTNDQANVLWSLVSVLWSLVSCSCMTRSCWRS